MEKNIRYLDYKVYRDNVLIHSGVVPEFLADGGSCKSYDLQGIWLTHSSSNTYKIEFYSGETLITTLYSDTEKVEWLDYLNSVGGRENLAS